MNCSNPFPFNGFQTIFYRMISLYPAINYLMRDIKIVL